MDKARTYQEALNMMAYITSHRLRQPIATMAGLLTLIKEDLISLDEQADIINKLNSCLRDLDTLSRELAEVIYNEQLKHD